MSHAKKNTLRKLSFLGFAKPSTSTSDGVGNEVAEVRLDDECAKVFAMDTEDRFNVEELHTDADCSAPRLYGEQDYQQHRKKSYPHIHVPLKPYSRSSLRKRVVSSPTKAESEHLEDSEYADSFPKQDSFARIDSFLKTDSDTTGQLSPVHGGDAADDEDTGAISSDTEEPVTDPANYDESPFETSPERRVQFTIDGINSIPEEENIFTITSGGDPSSDKNKKKRKHSRHHHVHHSRFRKYSLQEDPEWRKKSGTEKTEESHGTTGRRVSIQPEDTVLEEVDQDILDSHRSDDPRALRRHRTSISSRKASMVHIGRKEGGELLQNVLSPTALKKMYDHSPHEVFVQLDELTGVGGEQEWKETARWIKYEEDLEEGGGRWGRPHVASLSFHSLLNLRRCLETGLVILDLEEKDFPGIAYRVTEQMVVEELIKDIDKSVVMRCLLLRHRYVHNHHDRGFIFSKRNYASYTSLQNLTDTDKKKALHHGGENGKNGVPHVCDVDCRLIHPDNHTIVDMKEETYASSSVEDMKKAQKDHILRRIPQGAEAISVLVGTVDFLEQPTTAFIRLAEGCYMPSIMEVNIPVRFLFILLGPTDANLDYHEIGRSISTLMSNHQFHKIAYRADNRKALLSAINEFLDDSIVLPPGDWERQALLPFEELKAKSEAIRRRKQKALGRPDPADEATEKLLAPDGDGKKPPFQDPLKRTRRPFGGLINDLRRRYPFFKSDILEGLNAQCMAAAIFMYFAALSGAITFGGLMSDKTHNQIGISETLIATSLAGIVFAVFAGQPLVIVGSTGPLLLFDESLFQFCKANGIEYLATRCYIGIWLGVIALIVACLEGSVFVKLFTRFTEEIFSALISLLYIVESVMKLFFVFGRHPLLGDYCAYAFLALAVNDGNDTAPTAETMDMNDTMMADAPPPTTASAVIENATKAAAAAAAGAAFNLPHTTFKFADVNGPMNQPNTALFCCILALGTFAIAYYLRLFRNSQFLGRSARRALGDFGVPIAIIIMVFLDYIVPDTYTEKLSVPEGLSPSDPGLRGWLIDPSGSSINPLEFWVAFAAGIPAMLVYILLFMETHISELIIDKPERKLRKGSGFHLDIVLICLINVGCGFLGTPWMCAATVRSVAHVSAVTIMSTTHAPGDKPHLIEVKEQRVSGFAVATLVGLSVLMSPLLRLVPMSVLFGVFLYMGISSMDGIQFFDRIKLFFMPVKHHPHASYVRKVKTAKMHLFTFIQVMCLVVLWVVKSTKISLAFPFFLLLMIPLRGQLKYFFTPAELRALDGDQPDVDDDEPDFYAEAPLPG